MTRSVTVAKDLEIVNSALVYELEERIETQEDGPGIRWMSGIGEEPAAEHVAGERPISPNPSLSAVQQPDEFMAGSYALTNQPNVRCRGDHAQSASTAAFSRQRLTAIMITCCSHFAACANRAPRSVSITVTAKPLRASVPANLSS